LKNKLKCELYIDRELSQDCETLFSYLNPEDNHKKSIICFEHFLAMQPWL